MRCAAFLLAAGLLCGAETLGQGYSGGGGGETGTNLVGTTSVCSVGTLGTATSVCLEADLATFEGTADAVETKLGATYSSGVAQFNLPGADVGAPGTYKLFASDADMTGFAATLYNKSGGVVYAGFGAQSARIEMNKDFNLRWNASTSIDGSCTGCDTTIARSAAGVVSVTSNVIIAGGVLTASTMTAETTAQARTVTNSYTWTNAMVVALGAGLTGDINVVTLPAKTRLLNAYVVITGAAAGPATVTVSCGDAIAGTPFINYIVPVDAKAAANTVYGDAVAERGTSIDIEWYYLPSYTATTLVTCHFISSGANLDTVTGSTGRVILETELLP